MRIPKNHFLTRELVSRFGLELATFYNRAQAFYVDYKRIEQQDSLQVFFFFFFLMLATLRVASCIDILLSIFTRNIQVIYNTTNHSVERSILERNDTLVTFFE
jgi:hypothetical protein